MKPHIKIAALGLAIFCGCSSPVLLTQTETAPRRIMINPLEPGSSGVAITWRTSPEVKEGFVQWGKANPHPVTDPGRFRKQKALVRHDSVTYKKSSSVFNSFRRPLTGLSPGEKYMYRVGSDRAGWSEWIQFDLPAADAESAFTFIYMGDPQLDLHSQWSRTIRQAYASAPDASFILYAGDLVNRGYSDREWGDWYRAGDFIHRMIPSVMTPGNHEYEYPDLSPLWRTHFTLPKNGPKGIEKLYGTCYYIDYPAVRIISLDGTMSEKDAKLRKIQAEWLEEVLKNTDQQWIILTLHQPFYSTKASRDNPQIRRAFKPLMDKYGVDLVLQGHDHAYGRGMMGKNGPAKSGTMYVVSVSGPKMYEIGNEKNWIQKQGENTQLYQVITIRDTRLHFKSYTTTGKLFDAFTLKKSSNEHTTVLDGQPQNNGKDDALNVGLLPDTQGDGNSVAIYPMEAVLDKLQALGADIVIPVGDLTNHGTTYEFEQWTDVAEEYREAGIEFLPLMGNHETSYAYSAEWIDYMKEYIPEDAVHMSGAQYENYYVVRENVLIILLRYYNLPVAFQWIKEVVDTHASKVDHIVIASHDGLIGAKYGETREMIVEGTRGDVLLMEQWDEIRAFFSRHDVIWVQGHEHMYQRSVISAPIYINPASWEPSDGNYRIPQYTQIITGNASYKGYEFRYGEREKVQAVIQQKMNTFENGSKAFDVNASMLSFDHNRVNYKAYFTPHTVRSNKEGGKELNDPDWILMDQFTRTTDRCEKMVYPNSIPERTRPVLDHDIYYRTNECVAPDGSTAKLLDGVNNIFNRIDSITETLSWRQGFSHAESQMGLARLAYQYLFQYHEPWSPNLNSDRRLVPSDNEQLITVPATTIDLKEHLTLSWASRTKETLSDILIVSGTQVQAGTYINAYGMKKDIEKDTGHKRSQPDGSAKQPHPLPEFATKDWNAATAVADPYVLQFENSAVNPEKATLAYYEKGRWRPFAGEECIVNEAYDPWMGLLQQRPSPKGKKCADMPVVGFYTNDEGSRRWWVILQSDVKVALIRK